MARSGFYAWSRVPHSARARENERLARAVRTCYANCHGRYGSPRLYRELQSRGLGRGRHRLARLMRLAGLQARRRRRGPRPERGSPEQVVGNMLQRNFAATAPNQKWAADLTYIATGEGWLYVAVLLDLYSRRIVGWAMGTDLTPALTLEALQMALQQRPIQPGLLYHSDRGCQYGALPR